MKIIKQKEFMNGLDVLAKKHKIENYVILYSFSKFAWEKDAKEKSFVSYSVNYGTEQYFLKVMKRIIKNKRGF